MTIKHRYLAEPGDVLSITLACRQCMASVAVPIGKQARLPDACPSCHEGWFRRDTNDRKAINDLVQRLAELQGNGKDAPCQIRLEINPHT